MSSAAKQRIKVSGCYSCVSRAVQNNLVKMYNVDNVYLKLCMCTQITDLGKRTKFQREILMRSMISAIHIFRENILKDSGNVSETSPWTKRILICRRYFHILCNTFLIQKHTQQQTS